MTLQVTIPELRKKLDAKLAKLVSVRHALSAERRSLKSQKKRLRLSKKAQSILQEVAEQVQNKAHKRISSLVTQCLSLVFEDPYTFKIKFEKKRNKTEPSFILLRDGYEFDPEDSTGGGVLDVVSFALRLAALCMRLPPRRRVLILDEPFKHLSPDRRSRVREMMEMLAKKLEVQFIISTHQKALRMGKVIEMGSSGGGSSEETQSGRDR